MRGGVGQLRLELGRIDPTEGQLREAHRDLALRLTFEQAMGDPCFRIIVRNFAEARLRARFVEHHHQRRRAA